MSELKPCPFCRGEAEFVKIGYQDRDDIISPYVFCKNCGVTTAWYETKEEAKDAWNRRVTMNNELRLCVISYKARQCCTNLKGYFHRWEDISHIVPPSPVVGGHNGGVEQRVFAIVELEDGTVKEVYPTQIRFVSKEEWEKIRNDETTEV